MGDKYEINTPQMARVRILDQCFANPAIKWTRENLINKVIEEMDNNPDLSNYKTREYSDRTFANDKKYLGDVLTTKSDEDNLQGNQKYTIEVKKEYNNLGELLLVYYRYSQTNRSFLENKLSTDEIQKLLDAVQLIQQIKGFDKDNEINSILKGLDAQIKYHNGGQQVIGLQTLVADGYTYLDDLYNCIINKTVIEIEYEPFGEQSGKKVVHPYFIKQYNNRWFLLGYDDLRNDISNIPLDRIKGKLKPLTTDYKSPEDIFNPNDYFKDIIGVTNHADAPVEEIILEFTKIRAPYILTKKMHESQQILERKENGSVVITLHVKQNFELISLILGNGSQVTVLQPQTLVEEVKKQALEITQKYLLV